MEAGISLIAGLGNPGPRYAQTRHNAGFWLVDRAARQQAVSFQSEKKFHGEVCRLPAGDCRLLKPDTFMNRSGTSLQAIMQFYRIPVTQILVAHDELDLPPGTVRLKQGGGHGGHNGLRDIVQQLGSADFWRLRVGIGHPGHKDMVVNYVLERAAAEDENAIHDSIAQALDVLPLVLRGDIARAMNLLHRKKQAE